MSSIPLITSIAVQPNGSKFFTTFDAFIYLPPEKELFDDTLNNHDAGTTKSYFKTATSQLQPLDYEERAISTTSVRAYHKKKLTSICLGKYDKTAFIIGGKNIKNNFPSVFLSSSDAVTAWTLKSTFVREENKEKKDTFPLYELASRLSLSDSSISPSAVSSSSSSSSSFSFRPNFSCVSSCETALCICRSTVITILVISQSSHLELEFWSNICVKGPITSMQFLPNNYQNNANNMATTAPIIIVASEDLLITFWDVQLVNCIYSIQTASSIISMDVVTSFASASSSSMVTRLACLSFCNKIQVYDIDVCVKEEEEEEAVILMTMPNSSENNNFSSTLLLEQSLNNELCDSKPLTMRFVKECTSCIVITQNQLLLLNLNYSSGMVDSSLIPCLNCLDQSKNSSESDVISTLWSQASIAIPFLFLCHAFLPIVITQQIPSIIKNLMSEKENIQPEKNNNVNYTNVSHYFKPLIAVGDPPNKSPLALVHNYHPNREENIKSNEKKKINQIKSSGYGLLQPKISIGKSPSTALSNQKKKMLSQQKLRKELVGTQKKIHYPISCGLLSKHEPEYDDLFNSMNIKIPPISSLAFDDHATNIAVACQDNSLYILKLPCISTKYRNGSNRTALKKIAISDTVESRNMCSSISWSNSRKWIAFHDGIYAVNGKKQNNLIRLPKSSLSPKFYYMDNFMLSSSGSTLYMSHIPSNLEVNNNVKSRTTLKIAATWSHSTAQSITSMDAINSTFSHIIATAASDKSLRIIDAADENKIIWSSPQAAGKRAAHHITFPKVTATNSKQLPPESFNLLAAASTDHGGLVTLWDLRCSGNKMPVAWFQGHVNTSLCCRVTFSPCLRYIAVGSEGKCAKAALYDARYYTSNARGGETIRGVEPFARIGTSHKYCDDSVTDVQFNPIKPQLVTGSLSGTVRFYKAV